MELIEIQKFWLASSDDTLLTVHTLFNNNRFVHSLFFLHLGVEKLLKGLYVNRNNEEPPFGHNLLTLASKINDFKIDKDRLKTMAEISSFNIAARYDDYKNSFQVICNEQFTKLNIEKGIELILWIKSQFTS